MEECFARKSHELAAGQTSTTLTTDASPFPLPKLVQAPPWHRGAVPPDDGVRETRYLAELVPSSLSKEPKRPQTRLQSRKDSWVYPDPNVLSDSDTDDRGRGSTRSARCGLLDHQRLIGLGPAGAGGEVHYIGFAPKEQHYGYAGDAVRARGDSD